MYGRKEVQRVLDTLEEINKLTATDVPADMYVAEASFSNGYAAAIADVRKELVRDE